MNIKKIVTSVFVAGFIASVISCTSEEEFPISEFYNESFSNLNAGDLQNIETPFEAVFGDPNNVGGRIEEDFTTLAELAEKLAEIFPDASILSVEVEEHRGLVVWNFKIKMETGGIVKFKFVQDIGKIVKMKGRTGPYDYEIDPGGSFIPFSEAKALALEQVGGEVHSWSLEMEEGNEWEYEFHTISGDKRYEIEIKGFETEVISIKEKRQDQDEDNDGDDEGDDENNDGDDEEEDQDVAADIVNFAKEIFNGSIKHAERHHEGDRVLVKLYMINDAESIVELLIWTDPLTLHKAEGERGSFEYELTPGGDLLSLQVVLEDVYRETEGATLVKWELEKEYLNDQEYLWVYEFYLVKEALKYEVEIDATSGEFLKLEVYD